MSFKNGSGYDDLHRKLWNANLSKSAKKRPLPSEETKRKISNTLTGRTVCKEIVDKRAKSLTGRKRSEETKRKISNTLTGRTFSKESIDKMVKSHQTNCYITPVGTFDSAKEAAEANGLKSNTLKTRCYRKVMGFSIEKKT